MGKLLESSEKFLNIGEFIYQRAKKSEMSVKKVGLDEVGEPWGFNGKEYRRKDGEFFSLQGFKVKANREVDAWGQPLIEESSGPGVIALIIAKNTNRVLVSTKAEPGNDSKGHVLLAPSMQASMSNLKRKHGGKQPPLTQILDMPDVEVLDDEELPADGGRFYHKKTKAMLVSVDKESDIGKYTTDNHKWIDVEDIQRLTLVNPHLRDLLLMHSMYKKRPFIKRVGRKIKSFFKNLF